MDFRNLFNNAMKIMTGTFGEPVVCYPKCGGVYKLNGIFDNDFRLVDPGAEYSVSANQPILSLNLNDVKFDQNPGDRWVIRGVDYEMKQKREDGQGHASLILRAMKVKDANRDTKAPKI